MRGEWEDDEFIYFRDEEIQMLLDIRKYRDEKGEWPSGREFTDWEETEFKYTEVRGRLRGWKRAVEGAGGKLSNPNDEVYNREKLRDIVSKLAETSLTYEIGNEERHSPKGQAVPIGHWSELNEEVAIELPSPAVFSIKFEESYPEIVENLGHEHTFPKSGSRQNGKYDWDEIRNQLREDIQRRVNWRLETWEEGEIPSSNYFNQDPSYPSLTQMRNVLGLMEEWKDELGIGKQRNAEDVDVEFR